MTAPDVRRAGNGSGKITRDAVLAAALEIIDRDGTDALSMRRLACPAHVPLLPPKVSALYIRAGASTAGMVPRHHRPPPLCPDLS